MKPEEALIIHIGPDDLNCYKRLDQFLAAKLDHLSRSQIKTLFEDNAITSSDEKIVLILNKMPKIPCQLTINLTKNILRDKTPFAENIPLHIYYEDNDLLIFEKPLGLVIHAAPGHYTGTLVNALLNHYPAIKDVGDPMRPGIVHRLDKGTTGVMVAAKSQRAYEKLVAMFAEHNLKRQYVALAYGLPLAEKKGTVKTLIGRDEHDRQKMKAYPLESSDLYKHALTHYQVRSEWYPRISKKRQEKAVQLFDLTLETGRTHQIRVHLAQMLHSPILSDELYAKPEAQQQELGRQLNDEKINHPKDCQSFFATLKEREHPYLHAYRLAFLHPFTNEELNIHSPLPDSFTTLFKSLDLLLERHSQ
jgi:23S rRNA pseudouridine1911/1915/1917 synthase